MARLSLSENHPLTMAPTTSEVVGKSCNLTSAKIPGRAKETTAGLDWIDDYFDVGSGQHIKSESGEETGSSA